MGYVKVPQLRGGKDIAAVGALGVVQPDHGPRGRRRIGDLAVEPQVFGVHGKVHGGAICALGFLESVADSFWIDEVRVGAGPGGLGYPFSRRFPCHRFVDAVVCEVGPSLLVQKPSEGDWHAEAEFGAVRCEMGSCAAGGRMEFAGQQHQ